MCMNSNHGSLAALTGTARGAQLAPEARRETSEVRQLADEDDRPGCRAALIVRAHRRQRVCDECRKTRAREHCLGREE